MGIALAQGRYHLSFPLTLFQIISRVQDEDTRCFGNCFVKNVTEESWDDNHLSSSSHMVTMVIWQKQEIPVA